MQSECFQRLDTSTTGSRIEAVFDQIGQNQRVLTKLLEKGEIVFALAANKSRGLEYGYSVRCVDFD